MRAGSTGVDGCHLWPYVAGGDGATGAEYEVAVVLDSRPEPFGRMVDKLFDRQPVDVAGEDGPGDAEQEIDADADADADVDAGAEV
jgi:hypothetical protein